MPARYRTAPIIETVCEFQFSSEAWDWTIPGLLYREVEGDFSVKREQATVQFVVQDAKAGVVTPSTVRRLHFFRRDESAFIDVGENVLAVHHQPPYPGWEQFRPLITDTFNRYVSVAKPTGLKRIGLRYVNRLTLPEGKIELKQYLNYLPLIPKGLPLQMRSPFARVELLYPPDNGLLILSMGAAEGGGLMLDLDFVTIDGSKIELARAGDWVDMAHRNVENAFEASITDAARDLFGRVDLTEAPK